MRSFVVAALLVFAGFAASAHAASDPERAKSVEGLRAVEAHWTRAFVGGDEAYLNALLDPAYVSVNAKGAPRSKADIIALSRKIAAGPKSPLPPPDLKIDVRGDAGVVTGGGAGQVSVDVFYWRDGRWHAWYSQHTSTAT
jgi:hypothetical protein